MAFRLLSENKQKLIVNLVFWIHSFQGKYHHDENLVQERVSKTNQKSKNLKEIYFRNIVLIFQVFLSISAKVEKILLRSQFDEKHGC